jgi:hypothetical protein
MCKPFQQQVQPNNQLDIRQYLLGFRQLLVILLDLGFQKYRSALLKRYLLQRYMLNHTQSNLLRPKGM